MSEAVRAVERTIEAIYRIESAKLIAALARTVRDVGLAEELAHDALVAALETWPSAGIPDNPAAWLVATARNRAIDRLRRDQRFETKQEDIACDGEREPPDLIAALDDDVGDDLLRLVFTACHPVLAPEARVAPDAAVASAAGSRSTRSHVRSSCPRRRSRNGSFVRSGRSPMRTYRSRCPTATSW